MKLDTSNWPRRDPLTKMADIDSLRLGYLILAKKPAYWRPGFVPARPMGRVKYEKQRQVATFVVPLLAMGIALGIYGLSELVYAIAGALLLGWALDAQLQGAIAQKLKEETEADMGHRLPKDHVATQFAGYRQGRYELTKELALRLNLKPEELTTERIGKLADDFVSIYERWYVELAEKADLLKKVKFERTVRALGLHSLLPDEARPHHSNRPRRELVESTLAATAGVAAAREVFDEPDPFEAPSPYPEVNPANGLPMVNNTCIDVGGNMFGTGSPFGDY